MEAWEPCKVSHHETQINGEAIHYCVPKKTPPKDAIPLLEERIETFRVAKARATRGGWKQFKGWRDLVYFTERGSALAEGTGKAFIVPPERDRGGDV